MHNKQQFGNLPVVISIIINGETHFQSVVSPFLIKKNYAMGAVFFISLTKLNFFAVKSYKDPMNFILYRGVIQSSDSKTINPFSSDQ